MASIVTLAPTFELSPTQVFHFAEDTDSYGCCGCWRSKKKKPKEYFVNDNEELTPMRNTTHKVEARIIANKRLAKIVCKKCSDDPLEENKAFDLLRQRINHDFERDKITEERLIDIIRVINEVKTELRCSSDSGDS